MNNVLAKPVDLCCLKGDFHNGEPTGSTQQIDGIDTYMAKPTPETSNGNVILFFPDAFGLHMNSFLMMDAYAACGYLTLGVDYFLGDPVTKHSLTPLSGPNFDFEAWKNKHLHACEEAAERWVKAVKTQCGTSDAVQLAAVGCCWGTRFVTYQLSSKDICKAGAIAHPSFQKESDVSNVKEPIFFSVPSTDKLFEPPQRSRTIEILTENSNRFNMQVFSNVGHGFATLHEKWAKEQHFKSFVDWLDFWLTKK
ncbi:related to dienelactone hydrolase [Fusarium torulosum]|uniref:Related to dienelactone hydrolase n=1 Tax=Fusarium torulosum TaxID=33205 RepID=A0AAE8MCE6_9HYPO|nr:related to dienelactone hydrolase [Fusarium torulosum]